MGYKNGSHGFTGDIFVKQSFDYGVTWDTALALTDRHYVSRGTVHVTDSLLVATWQDQRYADTLSNSEIFCRIGTDCGQSWADEERVSFGYGPSLAPVSVSIGNVVHVFWGDYRDEGTGLYYRANDLLAGVEESGEPIPQRTSLLSCYPNPFNAAATIAVEGGGEAEIAIFDIAGRRVAALQAQNCRAMWDARGMSSGVYFARIVGEGAAAGTIKLVYLK
jgi:hypothetical protein